MIRDTPTIASSTYASVMHDFEQVAGADLMVDFKNARNPTPTFRVLGNQIDHDLQRIAVNQSQQNKMENVMSVVRRLVKVVIIDPNENIPLKDCILYSGDEQLTDLTDQELFFEIDIKQLLDAHNDKRTKVVDKKVKERTEFLEAAKIRDLKMVVVNIASF